VNDGDAAGFGAGVCASAGSAQAANAAIAEIRVGRRVMFEPRRD